jgi:hypothetical protein
MQVWRTLEQNTATETTGVLCSYSGADMEHCTGHRICSIQARHRSGKWFSRRQTEFEDNILKTLHESDKVRYSPEAENRNGDLDFKQMAPLEVSP